MEIGKLKKKRISKLLESRKSLVKQTVCWSAYGQLGGNNLAIKKIFDFTFYLELITLFVPMICQKLLFQSISLKIVISVSVVSLS
ncbi:hypothetical protein Hanom_Chr14g01256371 [Helianthus anomalus]